MADKEYIRHIFKDFFYPCDSQIGANKTTYVIGYFSRTVKDQDAKLIYDTLTERVKSIATSSSMLDSTVLVSAFDLRVLVDYRFDDTKGYMTSCMEMMDASEFPDKETRIGLDNLRWTKEDLLSQNGLSIDWVCSGHGEYDMAVIVRSEPKETHMFSKSYQNDDRQDDGSNLVVEPHHYTQGGIECWDAMEARSEERPDEFLGYLADNVFKYVWRFRDKDGLRDLDKASEYLEKLKDKYKEYLDDGRIEK